jgi:hypothetical protein
LEKIKEKSAFTLRYYQDLIAAQGKNPHWQHRDWLTDEYSYW